MRHWQFDRTNALCLAPTDVRVFQLELYTVRVLRRLEARAVAITLGVKPVLRQIWRSASKLSSW